MRKYEVLRAVVILQAVCMVVLTVVVVIKVWPGNERQLDQQPQTSVGSEEDLVDPGKPGQTPDVDSSELGDERRVVARVGKEMITAG